MTKTDFMETIPDNVDTLRNDFVDLTYTVYDEDNNEVFSYIVEAGKTEEDGWFTIDGEEKAKQYPQLKEDTTYHVTCTSTPIYNGTKTEQSNTEDATVYVFKPVVTLKDTTESYNDAVAGVDLTENRMSTTWVNENTDHAPEGTEPTLEYKFYNKDDNDSLVTDPEDHSMTDTTNYQVDVIIKGHEFSYTTNLPYYVKKDGSYVLVSEYTGDKSDLQPETYIEYDSQGNPTEKIVYELDENGNETDVPVYKMVVQPTEVSDDKPDVTDSDDGQHFTTYKNFGMDGQEEENTDKTVNRTEGNFTVYVSKNFTLNVQKIFAGTYGYPVEMTVNVYDDNDELVKTHTFTTSEFTRLESNVIELGTDLIVGTNYR
ncbi:MAG: hypothetical protein Q4C20_12365, partial [Erysipelotrichaceae bacterium]|nr:hypothetical protein [Erysipelotrichaceae bacterium]